MQLYFVRHGSAANKSGWTDDDALRPLTSSGRARFASAASALVSAKVLVPQLVISSPLVRARQTADLLCKTLDASVPLEVDERLGHEFDTDALRQILAEHPDVERLAVVGHNPSFAAVLCAILGDAEVDMRKGAIALVEITDATVPEGRLLWLAPTQLFPVAE